MSNIQHIIIGSGDDEFITVVIPGVPVNQTVAARSGNPNFDQIKALAESGEGTPDEFLRLFDPSEAAAAKFENVSDRVQVSGGRVMFDGSQVDNSLTKQIARFLHEDHEDFGSLVNFMEKVMDNPQPHSREQLYEWLTRHDATITASGDIVLYKGVERDGDSFRSISSGVEPVMVDGVVHKGRIPNHRGATVNMDRGLVEHNPAVGCHVGLHVGTYDYARSFSRGAVLECHVNPRDIVSVPTDCNAQKVRTCRYKVVDVIDQPYTTGYLDTDGSDLPELDLEDWDF